MRFSTEAAQLEFRMCWYSSTRPAALEIGFSPSEAIVAATRQAAEFTGVADSLGSIEPGKIADLVLLEADPLADITNTSRIVAVVQGGRLLDRATLDGLLQEALRDPAVAANDWLPPPPSPELLEARAIIAAIDDAQSPQAIAAALDSFAAFEGAARLPGGREALAARRGGDQPRRIPVAPRGSDRRGDRRVLAQHRGVPGVRQRVG